MIPILGTRRLAFFYRKLAVLISSGCSIIDALDIVTGQMPGGALKQASIRIKQDLSQGIAFGEAFGKFTDVFPAWQVNIIKYSESAGRLAQGFDSLANYLEKDYSIQLSIAGGLAYPVLLLHAAIFLLPAASLITCGGCGYLSGVLRMLFLLYGSAGLVYVLGRLFNTPSLKNTFDSIVLSIPVLGNITRQIAVTRFMRALQCLSSSGVSIISGWKIAAQACGNSAVSSSVLRGLPRIERGEELSAAFIQAGVFSADMVGMIKTAQKSGSLPEMLGIIADYSEKENAAATAVLAKIVPVIVYVLVAGFIAIRVISSYMSYFNRIFSFQG